jgi:hypothetical protein
MNTTQKRSFGHRINKWLDEPEGETFKSGKWRFWFLALVGLSILNAILTASIFGSNRQGFIGSITLAVGALVAWLCVGTLHYSDSRDPRLARGVSLLDSISLCFVIAHFCFLLWAQGHLLTIQGQEAEYKASAATYNEKAEKISIDNAKIAAAAERIAQEETKRARIENDTIYQARKAAQAGARISTQSAGGIAPSLSTSPIELEKPKAPAESSAAFLMKWDAWIRGANFGELILAAIALIFIRNRSAKFNAQSAATSQPTIYRDDFPAEIDTDVRSPHHQPRFDREASHARNIASQESGEASQDGLKALQEVCSAISFGTPGRWFAVDERGDHVRVRLRTRVDGREKTLKTARLTLEVLRDVLTMDRTAFTSRFIRHLQRRGFEINNVT